MNDTLPAKSRPRKAAARTTTGCPTLISPKSRSSSSARTRSAEMSPSSDQRLRRGRGSEFPGLGIDLQHGAGDRRTDRHLVDGRFGDRQLGARDVELAFGLARQRRVGVVLDPRSSALRCLSRSCARVSAVRAASTSASEPRPGAPSAAARSSAARASITAFSASHTASSASRRVAAPSARSRRRARARAARSALPPSPAAPAPRRRRDGSAARRRIPCRWP